MAISSDGFKTKNSPVALQILLDSKSHQPQPKWPMVQDDGNLEWANGPSGPASSSHCGLPKNPGIVVQQPFGRSLLPHPAFDKFMEKKSTRIISSHS